VSESTGDGTARTDSTRSGYVAVIGRPNVGKSTLTNLLVGEKVAIVSDVPQTTRNRIHGMVNLPGGQIVLVDTPGVHRPRHRMNRLMMAETTGAMLDVDLILFLIEADAGPAGFGPGDRFILEQLPRSGPPVVLVINKVDLVRKDLLLPLIERVRGAFPFAEILLISALTGDNTQGLAERILAHLPLGPPLFPQEYMTDQHERFLAAEIIREKLLHHTRQEIPHEICVLIDTFEEGDGLTRIEATVLVDRESQKGMVIGAQGALLKVVGTEAREELERMLDTKIFLKLWVKVREGWREDEGILRKLGISHS